MPKTAASFRRFELSLEALTTANSTSPAPIRVPAEPTTLALGETPRLVDGPPAKNTPAVVIEPVRNGRETALLIAAPAGRVLRVNGVPGGRVACVQPGDVVDPGVGDLIIEITMATGWRLGTPPEAMVGVRCPMCRTPFTEDTTMWLCPACGTGLHLEPGDDETAYKCLDLKTECPTCGLPIDRADEEAAAS